MVEVPINMKSIESSIKNNKYGMALLEIHRVVCILANHVKGMTEENLNSGGGGGGGNSKSHSGITTTSDDARNGRRGVTGPTEDEDEEDMVISMRSNAADVNAEEITTSPMQSHKGSATAARNAAAASLQGQLIRQNQQKQQQQRQASGNIRVATRIATEANGYDSDKEDHVSFNEERLGGLGGGRGGSDGAGAAWQTPRGGVSLHGTSGNGGGIRRGSRSKPTSTTPSVDGAAAVATTTAASTASTASTDTTDTAVVTSTRLMQMDMFGSMMEEQQQHDSKKDEEEERACQTIRQQMKQVTNMVLYRAKKLSSKSEKNKGSDDTKGTSKTSGATQRTLQLPKSPRRRSIVVDNVDEDDFSRLIHSANFGDALGITNPAGRSGSGGSDMKPKKPASSRKGRKKNRRGSVKRRTTKNRVPPGGSGGGRSISASTEF